MPDERPQRSVAFLITCEHASARIPAPLRNLGLPATILRSHHAFDVGALPTARALAKVCRAPLHLGKWSRLVVDLNRSEDHPKVIARRVGERTVPGNQLTPEEHQARIDHLWRPYRTDVERAATAATQAGTCLHLSVHSFTERLNGVERRNDIGLLFDPRRPREREVVEALRRHLVTAGLSVRLNFPYFGHTDGMTSHLRAQLPAARYRGIEIELNQRLSRTAAGQRRLTRAVIAAVRALDLET